jgi:hypothetical protein
MTVFSSNTVSVVATVSSNKFNIHKFHVLPTQCIYVFCVDLRTNSDHFPIQHLLTGFYNQDGVCLLRGTDWVFIYTYNSGYVFCVNLRTNSDNFPIQH